MVVLSVHAICFTIFNLLALQMTKIEKSILAPVDFKGIHPKVCILAEIFTKLFMS